MRCEEQDERGKEGRNGDVSDKDMVVHMRSL